MLPLAQCKVYPFFVLQKAAKMLGEWLIRGVPICSLGQFHKGLELGVFHRDSSIQYNNVSIINNANFDVPTFGDHVLAFASIPTSLNLKGGSSTTKRCWKKWLISGYSQYSEYS